MRLLASCFLALLAVTASSGDDAAFRLADLQWKHRVLLVFSPSEGNASFVRQYNEWKRTMDGMAERDLIWVPLIAGQPSSAAGRAISPDAQQLLRRQLRVEPGEFAVMLVGRDGGVKLRKQQPVDAMSLFALIDSMPMRRQEMRKQADGNP